MNELRVPRLLPRHPQSDALAIHPGESLALVNRERQVHVLRTKAPAGPHPPAPPDPGEDDFEVPADEGGSNDQGSKTRAPVGGMTLVSGRMLFDNSLRCWVIISSYFGTVVNGCRGTM